MNRIVTKLIILFCVLSNLPLFAQQPSLITANGLIMSGEITSRKLNRYLYIVTKEVDRVNGQIKKQNNKTKSGAEATEKKMMAVVTSADSVLAKKIFLDTTSFPDFNSLTKEYHPQIDTLITTLKYLKENAASLNFDENQISKLNETIIRVNDLSFNLNKSINFEQLLKEKYQYFKQELGNIGIDKYLNSYGKTIYGYSKAIKEYKALINNPHKIQQKVLALLSSQKMFKDFLKKNSQWASLFGYSVGGAAMNIGQEVSFTGVQTRNSVQQTLQNTFLSQDASPTEFLNEQMDNVNDRVNQANNSITLPQLKENAKKSGKEYRYNSQKNKSFFKRLEYGTNIQFGKANQYLPSSGELALTLGYKINDKSVVGLGTSYKLGFGSIRSIKFSHQGFGGRSFMDWRIKNEFFISGGYELNYLPQLENLRVNVELDNWQQSGLIGLTKKYAIAKKRKGTLQILFDFLSYQNIPRSQPFIFRTGINF